ncbi:GntR family transcriptional regulator [Nonomuraea ceibae]|uniref:GntR family transcriptional regulator n=1 Tax=Nonomuraea ceibae TaxID=1935170 RepID=UPI001C5DB2C0|nr:GntR family transcriptional regulator [Nonomuraea ceibae]
MRTAEILTGWRVYSQIADRLRARISEGVYPAGSPMPSEAELCAEFGVARNTARRALTVLEDEGLIVTIPSKGRVVSGSTAEPYRYRQIADDLRAQITSGALGPAVPSEAALRRRYTASRNTVRQALSVLEQEGLIHAEHGRGRFVKQCGETS